MLYRLAELVSLAFGNLSAPSAPFSAASSFLRFLPKFYGSLPKPRQRVITRFCPTLRTVEATQRFHTTLLTTFLHSTNCKNFCRGSPNNKFQLVHEFRSCKRKLLNTTVASFCRRTAHKTAEISTVHRFADHSLRPQITASDSQLREYLPQTTRSTSTQSQASTIQLVKRLARVPQTTLASA